MYIFLFVLKPGEHWVRTQDATVHVVLRHVGAVTEPEPVIVVRQGKQTAICPTVLVSKNSLLSITIVYFQI